MNRSIRGILAAVLCLSLPLALASCGEKPGVTTQSSTQGGSSTGPTTEPTTIFQTTTKRQTTTSRPATKAPSASEKGTTGKQDKVCYLTFDDGPSKNTPKILKILKDENIKATFFVIGQSDHAYMKDIVAQGHTIALHCYAHEYSKIYQNEDAYFTDLQRISDLVEQQTGVISKIIRFPGGASNTVSRRYNKGIMTRLTQQVQEKGYQYYDWNCSNGDADDEVVSAEKLLRNVKSNVGSQGELIVLMHDSYAKTTTVTALPDVIAFLKGKGYRFAAITPDTAPIHHRVGN